MFSIACLIVAAGASSRFGSPKQLALFKGKTLLAWAIHHSREAGFYPILLVSGAHQEAVESQLDADLIHYHHTAWQEGMPSSIRAGLAALLAHPHWQYCCILPADMPFFDAYWLNTYASTLREIEALPLVATNYEGRPGLPVIISRSLAKKIQVFAPEQPLRSFLIQQEHIACFPSGAHTKDIDQPEDLRE